MLITGSFTSLTCKSEPGWIFTAFWCRYCVFRLFRHLFYPRNTAWECQLTLPLLLRGFSVGFGGWTRTGWRTPGFSENPHPNPWQSLLVCHVTGSPIPVPVYAAKGNKGGTPNTGSNGPMYAQLTQWKAKQPSERSNDPPLSRTHQRKLEQHCRGAWKTHPTNFCNLAILHSGVIWHSQCYCEVSWSVWMSYPHTGWYTPRFLETRTCTRWNPYPW